MMINHTLYTHLQLGTNNNAVFSLLVHGMPLHFKGEINELSTEIMAKETHEKAISYFKIAEKKWI